MLQLQPAFINTFKPLDITYTLLFNLPSNILKHICYIWTSF